jgi:hypothetical protein
MKIKKTYFTLMELVVSMGVFAILLLSSTMIFNAAQKAWALSDEKVMTSNDARLALDVIAKDIESSICFYEYGGVRIKVPWWHKPIHTGSPGEYRNELLNMVSINNRPRSTAYTNLCEIKIQLYYYNDLTRSNAGKIYRSYTDIARGAKYNWGAVRSGNEITGVDENYTVGKTGASNAFTANTNSSTTNQALISYVYELNFYCYNEDGDLIENYIDYDAVPLVALPDTLTTPTEYPFSVDVELTLLPKESWEKWVVMAGTLTGESADAAAFREKHQQTYKKTVFLGDRGQYEYN